MCRSSSRDPGCENFPGYGNFPGYKFLQDMEVFLDVEPQYHTLNLKIIGRRKKLCPISYKYMLP